MAAKNRRTKKKDWDESSDETSDDDNSGITKRLENISYVKREKERELKKTKKVLSRLCDSDDDSDPKQKQTRNIRPMTSLPMSCARKFSRTVSSSSDDSSSGESQTYTMQSGTQKVNIRSKKKLTKKKLSSESDSERKKRAKRRKIESEGRKSSCSTKDNKDEFNKSKKIDYKSDSSSSKEFQQPQAEKEKKSRSRSRSSIAEHVLNDYSHLTTPGKSDGESISVGPKEQLTLKSYVIEETSKIQKMVEDLKDQLEVESNYLINKKVSVVSDSKFIAHKILRIYDSTCEKIKKCSKKFVNTYESWLETCNKSNKTPVNSSNKTPVHKVMQKIYDLSSNEDEDNEFVQSSNSLSKGISDENGKSRKSKDDKSRNSYESADSDNKKNNSIQQEKVDHNKKPKTFSISKDSSDSSENSSEYEKSQTRKKDLSDKQKNKTSKKSSKQVNSSDDETDRTEENENENKEKHSSLKLKNANSSKSGESKSTLKRTSDSSSKNNDKSISDSEDLNAETSDKSKSKLCSESASELDVDDHSKKNSKGKKDSKEQHADDSPTEVSDCDSDEIFSGDEERSKKSKKNKPVTESKEGNKTEKSEDETSDSTKLAILPNDLSQMNDSEDIFDSTASEIPNTPVKSPVLGKSLRKTIFLASKPANISQVSAIDEEDEPKEADPLSASESFNLEIGPDSEPTEKAPTTTEENNTQVAVDITTASTDVEDNAKERNAFEDLLRDIDSDQSTYCVDRNNDNSPSINNDDMSDGNSSRSTVIAKKPAFVLAHKAKNSLQMPSKKPNSISSDSSSSGEEEDRCHGKKGNDDSSSGRLRRRTAFNLTKNRHYLADSKLRARCQVVLERLPRNILKKHAKALEKSKKYVANKKFHSLTNLGAVETKKKSRKNADVTESSDIDSTTNSKSRRKNRDEKKSVKDHLGEKNDDDSGNDESDNASDGGGKRKISSGDISTEQNVAIEAENEAKEALLRSGSSSNDEDDTETTDVDKADEKKSKKTKEKNSHGKIDDSENKSDKKSEDENSLSDESKSKKKEKSAWKRDKILTFNVNDSESDEEKASKSIEKKRAKDKEKEDSVNEDAISDLSPVKKTVKKKRKQRKRMRLDSDSDAKVDSSDEESDASVILTGSEGEKEEKKKKSRKRRQKSSDSDSSSGEKKTKSKRRRIKKVASDSDSDPDTPGKGRKNIRKVLKDKHVAEDTKKAAQDEEERLRRIAERQKLFNDMYDARLAGEAKVDKLVLDVDEETKEELVIVNEELVKRLKPHQAKGIKFMWDACFESLKQMEESDGSGCIIAHCMGLGKTFQVVTLTHTLLTHEETKVNTVMVVCPLSTVLNWVNEFKTWLKYTKNSDDIEIYELTKLKKNIERKYMLESWQKTGGVLIIGYEMFRNLTSTGKRMRKAMQESVMRSLVDPGADLVVCDEGHLLKNEDSALSKAMNLVKTKRRIVLTGTPLQNNLKEYHCMVQFVKPNLLGTKKEFLNRFVNPITNGQFDDSTPYDVKLMKKRAHVLHKMLEGSVQRFDYSVLTPFLPPKQEYVIFVRLTEVQIKMYQHYLDNFARRFGQRNGSLFADFQELQRIWTHPYVLRLNAEKVEKANEKKRLEASDSEGSLKDFIDDDSESEVSSISSSHSGSNSDVHCIDSDDEKIPKATRSTRLNPKEEIVEEVPVQPTVEEEAWWKKYVEESHMEDLRISTKLTLLFGILKESEQIGDKVLVFSQSLYSLTLIEHFLNLIDQETQNDVEAEHLDKHSGSWSLGLDYFRLDGSTSPENRSAWCKIFNNPNNTRARLFLISTRAGGLGINLTAANRVIIFDASWNPSHDVQSIFRIYRFGQKKPCYVYRFLAAGTMEEKIYNRQVTKLSLACRVVDEQQIERHYSNNDLAELYQFESYEDKSVTLSLPKDRLLAEILLKYKDAVYNYHEHDSLLENKQEEELDEEERKQAWLEYEEEKQGKRQPNMGNNMAFNQMLMNMNSFPELENIKALLQKDYPNLPPEHLDTVARQAVYDMYRYVDQQAMNQMLNPFGQGQVQPQNMLGTAMQQVQQQQQQQQLNQQSQLLNMLNQPQMNYPGVNQMPAYSGRGRPPKNMSMNNLVNNPMANMRQMQTPLQLQQAQMQAMRKNDEVEILTDRRGPQTSNNSASNINNKPEE